MIGGKVILGQTRWSRWGNRYTDTCGTVFYIFKPTSDKQPTAKDDKRRDSPTVSATSLCVIEPIQSLPSTASTNFPRYRLSDTTSPQTITRYTYVETRMCRYDTEEEDDVFTVSIDLSLTASMLLWVFSTIPQSQGRSLRVGPVKRGLNIWLFQSTRNDLRYQALHGRMTAHSSARASCSAHQERRWPCAASGQKSFSDRIRWRATKVLSCT